MRLSFTTALLAVWVAVYVAAGLHTELELAALKPIPASLMQDFDFYRDALHAVADGNDPYANRDIGTGFLYPPPALLLVAVFEPFNDLWRASLFTTLNLALLALMLVGVSRRFDLPLSRVWWWFPLAFAFAPTLELLHIGQINLLVTFGVLIMFLFACRSPSLAGLGLGAAICLKVTPIAFFVYLAVTKRFRVLAVSLITVAVLVGGFGVIYSFQPALDYVDVFRNLAQISLPGGDGNAQSLPAILNYHGVIASGTEDEVQKVLDGALLAAILAAVGVAIARTRSDGLFVVIGLSLVPASNIAWYHHYTFLLLPLCVWMASMKLHPLAVAWVLGGLTLIQFDRFGLTHGLLAQVFILATIPLVLLAELRPAAGSNRRAVQRNDV